jgi:hypothetical protein
LFNTFSVKDVTAFGLNGILGNVIAQPANSGFTKLFVTQKSFRIAFAS